MIEQATEAYTWYALYPDGALSEHNAIQGFASVDQARVISLLLLATPGGAPHRVDIPPGAQAIFFRRRSIEINLSSSGAQGNHSTTAHCIGWKRGDEAIYLFVLSDGSTILTNNLQAV